MISSGLSEQVFALPESDRLELARKLVASIAPPEDVDGAIEGGVRRLEEIAKGEITGLSEAEFQRSIA
jgi:hypothetical protein